MGSTDSPETSVSSSHRWVTCQKSEDLNVATMKITNKMNYIDSFIIPSQLYMFRAMISPIIRSTWLFTVSGSVHPSSCRLVSRALVGRLSGIRTQSGQTEINDEL